jgi:hypothetical protein
MSAFEGKADTVFDGFLSRPQRRFGSMKEARCHSRAFLLVCNPKRVPVTETLQTDGLILPAAFSP